MTWWGTQLGAKIGGTGEPKRKYKFLVFFGGKYLYSLNSIDKPVATVENKEYQLINHHFSYPGTVKWNSINMNLVDFGSDLGLNSEGLWKTLTNSGYATPSSGGGLNTLEKGKTSTTLGDIIIYHLDSDTSVVSDSVIVNYSESWILRNPIIEKISWGNLSYAEEGFVEYELAIKYDWPEYKASGRLTFKK
jgi:hypothetical protein